MFTLCLDLGYPHPDYLKPLLSSRQFGEWEAFYLWKAGKIKPTVPDLTPEQTAAEIDKLLFRSGF